VPRAAGVSAAAAEESSSRLTCSRPVRIGVTSRAILADIRHDNLRARQPDANPCRRLFNSNALGRVRLNASVR